jgi:hypothetical protein
MQGSAGGGLSEQVFTEHNRSEHSFTVHIGTEHGGNNPHIETERRHFQAALGAYLSALDGAEASVLPELKKDLLSAYAEYRYQLRGGTHCTACHAAVRYFMTVEIQRTNGTVAHYAALCTRCLEAEMPNAASVTLRLGTMEYKTVRRRLWQSPARWAASA